MNKYINSNPWQRSGILKAHALNHIQKRNTIEVIVAAVLSKLYLSSGVSVLINEIKEQIDPDAMFCHEIESLSQVIADSSTQLN